MSELESAPNVSGVIPSPMRSIYSSPGVNIYPIPAQDKQSVSHQRVDRVASYERGSSEEVSRYAGWW